MSEQEIVAKINEIRLVVDPELSDKQRIRKAQLHAVENMTPEIVRIFKSKKTTPRTKVDAYATLAKFGQGEASSVVVGNQELFEDFIRAATGFIKVSDQAEFVNQLMAVLESHK